MFYKHLATVVALASLMGTSAIIRRADKPDSDFVIPESMFPAVFPFPQRGECGATLIAKQWAITAAHCFDTKGAFLVKAPFKVTIANKTNIGEKILLSPCFSFVTDSPNGADVALFKLKTPVTHVKPLHIYTDIDEVGFIGTILGWGDHGPASAVPPKKNVDGKFRRGMNRISGDHNGILSFTFDNPASSWGTSNVSPLEAAAFSGDSGGPLLIHGYDDDDNKRTGKPTFIAGVNSGGTCCKYGSKGNFARLSTMRGWIAESMRIGKAATMDCKLLNYVKKKTTVVCKDTAGAGMCEKSWCDLGTEFQKGCDKTCGKCKTPTTKPAKAATTTSNTTKNDDDDEDGDGDGDGDGNGLSPKTTMAETPWQEPRVPEELQAAGVTPITELFGAN